MTRARCPQTRACPQTRRAGAGERPDWAGPRRNILFIAWRDLANRLAGGSEVLVDQLASGLAARGHRVTLLAGGTVAERPYPVRRNGGTYSQFLRAPLAYLRNFRDVDLIVEVCNGMPFLVPLVVQKAGDLPGEPRAHRVVADPVPPAGLHRGPAHREHGHALGAPREPVPHRLPVHGRVAGNDGRRTRPDPADLQRRRPARPADATLKRPAVPGARPARRLQAPGPAAPAVGKGPPGDRRAAGHRRRRAGTRAPPNAGRTRRGVHRPGIGAGEAPAAVLGVAAGASGADRGLGHRGRPRRRSAAPRR